MSITLKRLNQNKVPFVGICLGVADMLGIKSFLGFFLNAAVTKHEPTMGFPPPNFYIWYDAIIVFVRFESGIHKKIKIQNEMFAFQFNGEATLNRIL